jgi:hypothetical protein
MNCRGLWVSDPLDPASREKGEQFDVLLCKLE